jgi:uncharacterized integral membrane protein
MGGQGFGCPNFRYSPIGHPWSFSNVSPLHTKDLVRNFGFVPNGTRVYYLDRSQPPLLTDMAMAIFDATGDKEWLSNATQLDWDLHQSSTRNQHESTRVNCKGLFDLLYIVVFTGILVCCVLFVLRVYGQTMVKHMQSFGHSQLPLATSCLCFKTWTVADHILPRSYRCWWRNTTFGCVKPVSLELGSWMCLDLVL